MKLASRCLVLAIVSVFGFAAAPAQAGGFGGINLGVDVSRPFKEVVRPITNPTPAQGSTLPVIDTNYDLVWNNNSVWIRRSDNPGGSRLLYQASVRYEGNAAFCYDPQGRTRQQLRTPQYDRVPPQPQVVTNPPWIDRANGSIVVTRTVNGLVQGHTKVGQATLQMAGNGYRYWVAPGLNPILAQ